MRDGRVYKLKRARTAWKKARRWNARRSEWDWVIVELLIPAGATVVEPYVDEWADNTHKLRTDEARIVQLYYMGPEKTDWGYVRPHGRWANTVTEKTVASAYSMHETVGERVPSKGAFKYVRGRTVRPREPLNTSAALDCASGIHFYWSKKRAMRH